jgi:hypothetical protein
MTAPDPRRRRRRPRAFRLLAAGVTAPARALTRVRRNPPPESISLLGLLALVVMFTLGTVLLTPAWFPPGFLVLPVIVGGLLLGRRFFRLLALAVAVALGVQVERLGFGISGVRPGALLLALTTAGIAYEFARSREETGLSGAHGQGVLVELRHRLQQQGSLPALPPGWHAEAVVRPAGGGPFAGDFVVASLTRDGRTLELAVVDVSGKGVAAGTRALMLSGALGGLLGSVESSRFLPAANAYLDRQAWGEGFATAVHLALDLVDGSYVVESAGHPPAAEYDAGSGRWRLLPAEGLALGLLPHVEYLPCSGRIEEGDALLLYTDGLVEVPGRDLEVGIDKLLGEAERLIPTGFTGGVDLLVQRVAGDSTDDRGLVLVWRGA